MAKIAEVLLELMNKHQLNPNSLAAQSGVPYTTIYRLLNDETDSPRAATIERLALFFGVSSAEMRGETPVDSTPLSPHTTRLIAVIRRADRNRYLSEDTAAALATIIDRLR